MSEEHVSIWIEDMYGSNVGLKLRVRNCLSATNSPFQRIAVYDTLPFGKVLTLGGAIALSETDEALYSEFLVHPALAVATQPERVLILGGGDGGVCREVLRHATVKQVTVVELDQQVVDTCRAHFPASAASLTDARTRLVIDDAHRFLRNTDAKDHYDVIIVDACELENPSSDAFHTMPFAQAVFRCLKPGGILVAPLGSPAFAAETCRATLRTLVEKFPKPALYQFSLPTQPGGHLAVAWCSANASPTTAITAQPWHRALKGWRTDLQAALFALPTVTRQQLGLPV